MLDDLLDYCPSTDAGKPTLSDSAQGRWTWPLALLATDDGTARARDDGFRPHTPELVADALFRETGTAVSPARRALGMLDAEIDALVVELNAASSDTLILALLERWRQTAHAAIRTEESRRRPSRRPRSTTRIITAPEPNDVGRFMSRHSRSFRFATLLLPSAQRTQIERVYAWCRYTDDIVDRVPTGDPGAIAEAEARLDAWVALSRAAYGGEPSGIALIDAVMGDMARHAVPFSYANLLAEGVRMDLRPREYRSMNDLREYTHRVASVVGLWLCGLYSVADAAMLDRAAALGHAMQVTNILRDVGEDLGQGRLYLPLERLERHGLERADLEAMRSGAQPIVPAYCAVIEEMIGVAELSYRHAGEAIAALPPAFGRSVAVAAAVYAKIHDRIRANGYDNLRRRAYTTSIDKVVAGTRGLFVLRAPRPVMRQANRLRTNG
jgi:phytoene synthase